MTPAAFFISIKGLASARLPRFARLERRYPWGVNNISASAYSSLFLVSKVRPQISHRLDPRFPLKNDSICNISCQGFGSGGGFATLGLMMADGREDFEYGETAEVRLSLGEDLCAHREAVGMSVEDMAREIKTAPRYVRALEAGEWREFGAKVYAQGVARRMGRAFGAEYGDQCARMCGREWDNFFGTGVARPAAARQRNRNSRFALTLTPRRLGGIAVAGFVLALAGFLAIRIAVFAAAPALAIREPADKRLVHGSRVRVAGSTEKESRLTVNGRSITIDESGHFNEEIELQSGLTRLEFISEDRFGKKSQAERFVVSQD